ncbi:HlyD family efflux transporter periplasmic adaptor subunit [Escherichia coli]|uniref:HlyD family efflux transporter periplasmic adaptor subunit n=1 Tax=Escherichia coli TaxID=562 RepID=UPI00227DC6DC|nr:HlyD family efflux transporter periplasmic adaptor subunit [Escherichia coli]MCY9860690.1 HlyD family efflux transporter periplasmic adaptor subunit [Escherichia coli]
MSIALFYSLAARVKAARSPEELGFVICNDTRSLVEYRQAALLAVSATGRAQLAAHSGLSDTDRNTPYALWLAAVACDIAPRCAALPETARVMPLSPEMLSESLAREWDEWLPGHVWVLALTGPDGKLHALLLLARDTPWPTQLGVESPEYALLQLANLYGYAWWALVARPSRLQRLLPATVRRRAGLVLLLLLLVMLIPIREYTLVPAEVISLNSEVIAAPSDGVIHQMKVPPNTSVVAGQVLAELDDTTLKNRLAIAQAELSIRARSSGVFVYTDPDDWAGRPVQTGERIGLLADPTKLGVRAWAPAAESTNLNPHAAMTVFLKVAPLHPLTARLDYAGYETVEAPNGVASYLLRGTVTDPSSAARIGLQGTARVSGDWSLLGYLIFRRPLATLRAWCGF